MVMSRSTTCGAPAQQLYVADLIHLLSYLYAGIRF